MKYAVALLALVACLGSAVEARRLQQTGPGYPVTNETAAIISALQAKQFDNCTLALAEDETVDFDVCFKVPGVGLEVFLSSISATEAAIGIRAVTDGESWVAVAFRKNNCNGTFMCGDAFFLEPASTNSTEAIIFPATLKGKGLASVDFSGNELGATDLAAYYEELPNGNAELSGAATLTDLSSLPTIGLLNMIFAAGPLNGKHNKRGYASIPLSIYTAAFA